MVQRSVWLPPRLPDSSTLLVVAIPTRGGANARASMLAKWNAPGPPIPPAPGRPPPPAADAAAEGRAAILGHHPRRLPRHAELERVQVAGDDRRDRGAGGRHAHVAGLEYGR